MTKNIRDPVAVNLIAILSLYRKKLAGPVRQDITGILAAGFCIPVRVDIPRSMSEPGMGMFKSESRVRVLGGQHVREDLVRCIPDIQDCRRIHAVRKRTPIKQAATRYGKNIKDLLPVGAARNLKASSGRLKKCGIAIPGSAGVTMGLYQGICQSGKPDMRDK